MSDTNVFDCDKEFSPIRFGPGVKVQNTLKVKIAVKTRNASPETSDTEARRGVGPELNIQRHGSQLVSTHILSSITAASPFSKLFHFPRQFRGLSGVFGISTSFQGLTSNV